MIKAFVCLPKGTELVDGKIDFCHPALRLRGITPVIYHSLNDAIKHISDDNMICEFEFTKPEEVIEAVNAATKGDSWEVFHVKWVNRYGKI